jgi:hypothetical protein
LGWRWGFVDHEGGHSVSFPLDVLDDFDIDYVAVFIETFLQIHDEQAVFEFLNSHFDDFLLSQFINFALKVSLVNIPPSKSQVFAEINVGSDVSFLFFQAFNFQSAFVDDDHIFVVWVRIFLDRYHIEFLGFKVLLLYRNRSVNDLVSAFEKCAHFFFLACFQSLLDLLDRVYFWKQQRSETFWFHFKAGQSEKRQTFCVHIFNQPRVSIRSQSWQVNFFDVIGFTGLLYFPQSVNAFIVWVAFFQKVILKLNINFCCLKVNYAVFQQFWVQTFEVFGFFLDLITDAEDGVDFGLSFGDFFIKQREKL